MAMTIAPTLKITSTSVSVKETFSLNLTDILTVDTPLTNITKVATVVSPGVQLIGPIGGAEATPSTKVMHMYVYNTDTTDSIFITYDTAAATPDPESVTVIGPGEFSFWNIPIGVSTVFAFSSANTPVLEYGFWTKG